MIWWLEKLGLDGDGGSEVDTFTFISYNFARKKVIPLLFVRNKNHHVYAYSNH